MITFNIWQPKFQVWSLVESGWTQTNQQAMSEPALIFQNFVLKIVSLSQILMVETFPAQMIERCDLGITYEIKYFNVPSGYGPNQAHPIDVDIKGGLDWLGSVVDTL